MVGKKVYDEYECTGSAWPPYCWGRTGPCSKADAHTCGGHISKRRVTFSHFAYETNVNDATGNIWKFNQPQPLSMAECQDYANSNLCTQYGNGKHALGQCQFKNDNSTSNPAGCFAYFSKKTPRDSVDYYPSLYYNKGKGSKSKCGTEKDCLSWVGLISTHDKHGNVQYNRIMNASSYGNFIPATYGNGHIITAYMTPNNLNWFMSMKDKQSRVTKQLRVNYDMLPETLKKDIYSTTCVQADNKVCRSTSESDSLVVKDRDGATFTFPKAIVTCAKNNGVCGSGRQDR